MAIQTPLSMKHSREGNCDKVTASVGARNATIKITATKPPFTHAKYTVMVDGEPERKPEAVQSGAHRNVAQHNMNLFEGTLEGVAARIQHVRTGAGPIVQAFSETVGLLQRVADFLKENSPLLDTLVEQSRLPGTG